MERGWRLEGGAVDAAGLDRLTGLFHRRHENLNGYAMPDHPLEIVTLRLGVIAKSPAAIAETAAADCRRRLESYESETGAPAFETLHIKPHLYFSWSWELTRSAALTGALRDLIGPDVLVLASRFWINEPGDGAFVTWHQDTAYFGLEPPEMITLWIALTEAGPDNGGMRFLPGSHRGHVRRHGGAARPRTPVSRGPPLMVIQAIAGAEHFPGRQEVSFSGHLSKVAVAVPCFLVALFLRPRWLRRNAWILYGLCMGLVVLVPFIGVERNHARRWIDLMVFDLQPSELAKLGLILILARVLQSNRLRRPRDWVLPSALVCMPVLFILRQPDLGTAMTLVPISLGMFYLAGARGRAIVKLVLCCTLLGVCAFQFRWVQGYQVERIETWLLVVALIVGAICSASIAKATRKIRDRIGSPAGRATT